MTQLTNEQRVTLANALAAADAKDGKADGNATRANLLATFGDVQLTQRGTRTAEIAQLVTNMLYDTDRQVFRGLNAADIRVAATPRDMLGGFARVFGVDVRPYVPPIAAYRS